MPGADQPGRERRRWRARAAFYGVIVLSLALLGLSGFMERLFFFPDRTPFATAPGATDVSIAARDGLALHGWFFPAPAAPDADPGAATRAPAVLFCHGNAGNVSSHDAYAKWLSERGFHVLVFDYRGYGRSDLPKGGITRAGLLADANAALDWLLARPDVDASRVGVYGYSLGAAVALALAAERGEVGAVVTTAGFASWRSIADDHAPLLGRLMVRSGMDPVDSAARLGDRPLLIVHPGRDEIVPVAHAARIEKAAREAGVAVEMYISPGTTHNDAPFDDAEINSRIAGFLRRSLFAGQR